MTAAARLDVSPPAPTCYCQPVPRAPCAGIPAERWGCTAFAFPTCAPRVPRCPTWSEVALAHPEVYARLLTDIQVEKLVAIAIGAKYAQEYEALGHHANSLHRALVDGWRRGGPRAKCPPLVYWGPEQNFRRGEPVRSKGWELTAIGKAVAGCFVCAVPKVRVAP